MIVDDRTCELQPGRLHEFLALHERDKILVPAAFSPTK
jgi:hypothetical protein